MRNLVILLVIVAGSYQLYTRYQSYVASAYDEYANPQTLLFTMNHCKPCDDARALLIERGVEFEEFNVSDGEAQAKKMKSYGGGRGFPYLVSGNQTLSGFYRHQFISTLAEVYGDQILTRPERILIMKVLNLPSSILTGTMLQNAISELSKPRVRHWFVLATGEWTVSTGKSWIRRCWPISINNYSSRNSNLLSFS